MAKKCQSIKKRFHPGQAGYYFYNCKTTYYDIKKKQSNETQNDKM